MVDVELRFATGGECLIIFLKIWENLSQILLSTESIIMQDILQRIVDGLHVVNNQIIRVEIV